MRGRFAQNWRYPAKTPDELAALLLELRKEQFNLRFQRATGQNKVGRVKQARREIARVKTVQGQHKRDARNASPDSHKTRRGSRRVAGIGDRRDAEARSDRR